MGLKARALVLACVSSQHRKVSKQTKRQEVHIASAQDDPGLFVVNFQSSQRQGVHFKEVRVQFSIDKIKILSDKASSWVFWFFGFCFFQNYIEMITYIFKYLCRIYPYFFSPVLMGIFTRPFQLITGLFLRGPCTLPDSCILPSTRR